MADNLGVFSSSALQTPAVSASATGAGPGSNAVHGTTTSPSDSALYGEHQGDGIGVFGRGGTQGGEGVFGETATMASGVFGHSSTGSGVAGLSETAVGVYGRSNREGVSDIDASLSGGIGVLGENNLTNGYGVQGDANGVGGTGVTGNGGEVGVSGIGVQVGVNGISPTGTGVVAGSTSGTGLRVRGGGRFDAPQVVIQQTQTDDFARVRFSPGLGKAWDIAVGDTVQAMNFYSDQTGKNVLSLAPTGDAKLAGSLHQHSSREFKDNISDLSREEALSAVMGLNPVKFSYKSDNDNTIRLGFIAEDVPSLLASQDRTTVCQMDIVAVLTSALQQQQELTVTLAEKVAILERQTVRGTGQAGLA